MRKSDALCVNDFPVILLGPRAAEFSELNVFNINEFMYKYFEYFGYK